MGAPVKHHVTHRVVRVMAALVAFLLGIVGVLLPAPAAEPTFKIVKTARATFEPTRKKPVFVLVIGNDYRPGVDGKRADALHLIAVNPKKKRGTMLNIPRDTWVDIPGAGFSKINSANTFGGPTLQASAVRNLTGIQPDFVVMTDFGGFQKMVNELGGVKVKVPFAMNDANSGARFRKGVTRMNGPEALAFSRNRYIGGGDFKRSFHQGLIILSALRELRGDGRSPSDTLRYLGVLYRNATVEGVDGRELYHLARLALSLPPERIRNVTMPGRAGSASGQSVVFVAPSAAGLFRDMRDDGILQKH